MKRLLDSRYNGEWILFYHSLLHFIQNGTVDPSYLQIAVKGLKTDHERFTAMGRTIDAYRWNENTIWPKFPLDINTPIIRSKINIPSNYTECINTLYGNSLKFPQSEYAPDVMPKKTKKPFEFGWRNSMGYFGNGPDVSDLVTVFILDGKPDINFPDCIEALKNQDCIFKVVRLVGYSPLSTALNQMLDCPTPYFIQLDKDMVIYPHAVRTMLESAQSEKVAPFQVFLLKDILSNRDIQGIKIYNKELWGKEKWQDCTMPSLTRLKSIRAQYKRHSIVLGDHSPKWSDRAKFDRCSDLANIYKDYKYPWIEEEIEKATTDVEKMGYAWGMYHTRNGSKGILTDWHKVCNALGYLEITHICDQYGWAFDHIANELAKYSHHKIVSRRVSDMPDKQDIVHVHGLGCRMDDIPTRRDYVAIGQYSGLCSRRFTNADYELSISDKIDKAFPEANLYRVREGIDAYYWTPAIKMPLKFTVGWSGRHHKVKRPHLLDKLPFDILRKDDWGKDFFKANRDRTDQLKFYRDISCLILVSESECQPRVILEAMACGLPVIAPAIGCIPDMIGSDWLVDVEENYCVEQITEKLKMLENNPNLAKAVGLENRQRIEDKWSWDRLAPLWDSFYFAVKDRDEEAIGQICALM